MQKAVSISSMSIQSGKNIPTANSLQESHTYKKLHFRQISE